jgi:AmmeMemoRadiSam system protein A
MVGASPNYHTYGSLLRAWRSFITLLEGQMQSSLNDDEKRVLLRLARESLESAVHGKQLPQFDPASIPERLRLPGASFVTLTRRGALRGCIGALQAQMPLAEDVQQHAAAAALEDYRFPPVQPIELGQIEIEISVLTDPQPLVYEQPGDLLRLLRPEVDGVIVSSGFHRATFLPQVWEKVPEAEVFLDMLCEKAGLAPNAWRQSRLQVQTYQVQSFDERETTSA